MPSRTWSAKCSSSWRCAGPLRTATARAPRGLGGQQVERAVTHHGDARRVHSDPARERQHHARLGLAAVPRIIAGDEVHMRIEAECCELPPRARLAVIGRETELQTAGRELPQHAVRLAERRKRPQRLVREGTVQVVEHGLVCRAPQGLGPEVDVSVRRARDQGWRRREATVLDRVMHGFDEPRDDRLIAAAQVLHDCVTRTSPGLVEIDQRPVLVE